MSEKATRSVVCERHGLRYDPSVASGCVRCRRDSSTEAVSPGRRSTGPPLAVWLIGAAVAVTLVVWLGGLGGGGEEAEQNGDPSAPKVDRSARASSSSGGEPASPGTDQAKTADGFRLIEGNGRVTIDDPPESEPFRVEEKWAPDLRSVSFRTGSDTLIAEIELVESVSKAANDFGMGIQVAALFFDTDRDATTGEKGFAGRVGFETRVEVFIGVRYSPDQGYFYAGGRDDAAIHDFRCSHSVVPMTGAQGQNFYFASDSQGQDHTECRGSTIVVEVPYRSLGVESGQVVRIATEESMGSGKVRDYYLDDALMTL